MSGADEEVPILQRGGWQDCSELARAGLHHNSSQSKMDNRCDRVQLVWTEVVSLSPVLDLHSQDIVCYTLSDRP